MIELGKHDCGSLLLLGHEVHNFLEVGKALGLDRPDHDRNLGLSLLGLSQCDGGSFLSFFVC